MKDFNQMLQCAHFLQAPNMNWNLLETEADFLGNSLFKVSRRSQEWHLLFRSRSRTPTSLEGKKKKERCRNTKSEMKG